MNDLLLTVSAACLDPTWQARAAFVAGGAVFALLFLWMRAALRPDPDICVCGADKSPEERICEGDWHLPSERVRP